MQLALTVQGLSAMPCVRRSRVNYYCTTTTTRALQPRRERSQSHTTFRCHVFSGTNYYMGKSGTHGTSADYSCPAGMTDVVANSADCGVLVMCSGTPAGTHTGHG